MAQTQYFDLTIPAARRLAMMRADYATHSTRYPHCPEHAKPADWRAIRGYTHSTWRGAFMAGIWPGVSDWHTHGGPQFRNERDAGDIVSSLPCGWYTDAHQHETAVGIVASLPHGRFIAGYRWTSNDERVYFPEVFTDEREAARRADSHAEQFADDAREDSERFDAMQDAENEAETARDACRLACMARHVSPEHRELAREACEALREALDTLAEKTAAYEKG